MMGLLWITVHSNVMFTDVLCKAKTTSLKIDEKDIIIPLPKPKHE